jgi:Uma2 family endonuclease
MVAHAKQNFITPEEYLRREVKSDNKHEYVDGVIVAMSGGTVEHAFICTNISESLGPQLRSRACRGVVLEIRIRQLDYNRYYYPDYTIICGNPVYEDIREIRSLVNPSVIFEVISPSTEKRDRGEKWLAYKRLASLRTYVLVHQDRALLEVFNRIQDSDEWTTIEIAGLDATLVLASLDVRADMAEIYRDIAIL